MLPNLCFSLPRGADRCQTPKVDAPLQTLEERCVGIGSMLCGSWIRKGTLKSFQKFKVGEVFLENLMKELKLFFFKIVF